MQNFTLPNEPPGEVLWGVIIVLYPFLTCMVDGCALVASLPTLFRSGPLKPIARLALLLSLSFIPVAFVPLLCDVGQPTRALHIMLTPRLSSPMAIFGFIFSVVAGLITLEAWLTFRPDLVKRWGESRGPLRWLFALLSLGVRPVTPEARRVDHKVIKILEILALPAAVILTGYVGFIFGTMPANPWWSSPLRPLVFLATASVAGFSAVVVAGILARRRRLPDETVRGLAKGLICSLVAVAALGALEMISILYPGGTARHVVAMLLGGNGPVSKTFFIGQLLLGMALPLLLLSLALVFRFRGAWLRLSALASGVLGIAHTFLLLWNVVIGGQLASKSLRGLITYEPDWGGRKGLLVVMLIACLPVVLLVVYSFLVPVFQEDDEEEETRPPRPAPAMSGAGSNSVVKWPPLLLQPRFAEQRAGIEAPYRRSAKGLSTPTAKDYADMVPLIESMTSILKQMTSQVSARDYLDAEALLNRLAAQALSRSLKARTTPALESAPTATSMAPAADG